MFSSKQTAWKHCRNRYLSPIIWRFVFSCAWPVVYLEEYEIFVILNVDIVYLDPEFLNIIKLQDTNCYIKYNSVLIRISQNIYWATTKEAHQFLLCIKRNKAQA